MKKQMLTVLSIILTGIIAGCGSSGSSTSASPSGTSTTSVSGKVADGYLVGATVFLDKNDNYQLDPGEPSAITDANGGYTLTVDPADVGRYPIVAMAIQGQTIDMDHPDVPVASSYVLSMPKTAISGAVNSNFISPMSSQLRVLMETGKYASMQQAMNELRTKLGMPAGTNMMSDYMAANNATMHTAAQNMASLMGSQMAHVLGSNGSATTVDVNRYRGMMGTIFTQMSSIKGSSPNTQAAMSNLMGTTMPAYIQSITPGQPFRNMSSAFRGSMMGTGPSSSVGTATGSTMMSGRMM